VAEARGQFGNQKGMTLSLFKAITIGLVKRQQTEKTQCGL
jgi:hypothetical protein